MTNINLITPPDTIYSDHYKILLVNYDPDVKQTFINAIAAINDSLHYDVYDYNGTDIDFLWLLDVANQVDKIVLNVNQKTHQGLFFGVLFTWSKTYWSTTQYDSELEVELLERVNPRHISSPVDILLNTSNS